MKQRTLSSLESLARTVKIQSECFVLFWLSPLKVCSMIPTWEDSVLLQAVCRRSPSTQQLSVCIEAADKNVFASMCHVSYGKNCQVLQHSEKEAYFWSALSFLALARSAEHTGKGALTSPCFKSEDSKFCQWMALWNRLERSSRKEKQAAQQEKYKTGE